MYFDTHVHSMMSPDSDMPPEAAIRALRERGLGIVFTEHIDYDDPNYVVDLSVYPEAYLPYHSDTVLLGLEIGLTAESAAQNAKAAAIPALDYIIGSIHFVDGKDISGPYFELPYTEQIFYQRYLAYARTMVEQNDFFDALGHFDYISRYTPLPVKEVLYQQYPDDYDALLQALIDRGKVLEINTERFRIPEAAANRETVLRRYHKLGGKFVTIGSDAHSLASLGQHFDDARALARTVGLTPVYFKNRKMCICENAH